MQNLIVACWAEKPEDRPSMDQIMDALEQMERDLSRTAMDARSLTLLEEVPEEVQKLFEEERKRVLDERKRNNLLQSIIDQQKHMLAVAQREIFKTKAELDREKKSRELAEVKFRENNKQQQQQQQLQRKKNAFKIDAESESEDEIKPKIKPRPSNSDGPAPLPRKNEKSAGKKKKRK